MSEPPVRGTRLDSWKGIAEYLQRDVATVARWEKSLGLPVHRVGGTGRSVFAYTSEIDDWLRTARPTLPAADAPPVPSAPIVLNRPYPWRSIAVTAVVLAVAGGLFAWAGRTPAGDLRVEVTGAGVIARNAAGLEQWRHAFPGTHKTLVLPHPVSATGGARAGVYFATSYRVRQSDERAESGVLTLLDGAGRPRRSFSFGDQVAFGDTWYGPPWAMTAFAVRETGGLREVAVAAHHYVWDAGLVTILDSRWQRRGTFVHAGWIEAVRWLGPERLVIGGFSNARDGGMMALLDAAAIDGQGPEPGGSPHFCESCGADRPLRMFVFPRSELNRLTASRFNRALVQTLADGRLVARTIEIPSDAGDADALYEFTTPSLDLVSARFSERYWAMHRALEMEGRLTHTRDQCPERDGPRLMHVWEPVTGWREVPIGSEGRRTM